MDFRDYKKVECSQAELDASAEKWSARMEGASMQFFEKHRAMNREGTQLLGVVYWTGMIIKDDGTEIAFSKKYCHEIDKICADNGIAVRQAYSKNLPSSPNKTRGGKSRGVPFRTQGQRIERAGEYVDEILGGAKDEITQAIYSTIDRDAAVSAVVDLLEQEDAQATALSRQKLNGSKLLTQMAKLTGLSMDEVKSRFTEWTKEQ